MHENCGSFVGKLSCGVTQFQITIDGTAESHDTRRITKAGEPTFDIIMKNIVDVTNTKIYKDYNCNISIRVNIDKTNYQYVEPLIEKINKIRTSTDKDEVSNIKNSLIAIMFNGTFADRSDNGLIEHSGMCILDFDKYPSIEIMNEEREKLIKDKYTLMVFTSPSGNGLKALIRIPKCNKLEPKRRFTAYSKYINSDYFDIKNFTDNNRI